MFGVITHLMTHDMNATCDVEGAVPYPAATGLWTVCSVYDNEIKKMYSVWDNLHEPNT